MWARARQARTWWARWVGDAGARHMDEGEGETGNVGEADNAATGGEKAAGHVRGGQAGGETDGGGEGEVTGDVDEVGDADANMSNAGADWRRGGNRGDVYEVGVTWSERCGRLGRCCDVGEAWQEGDMGDADDESKTGGAGAEDEGEGAEDEDEGAEDDGSAARPRWEGFDGGEGEGGSKGEVGDPDEDEAGETDEDDAVEWEGGERERMARRGIASAGEGETTQGADGAGEDSPGEIGATGAHRDPTGLRDDAAWTEDQATRARRVTWARREVRRTRGAEANAEVVVGDTRQIQGIRRRAGAWWRRLSAVRAEDDIRQRRRREKRGKRQRTRAWQGQTGGWRGGETRTKGMRGAAGAHRDPTVQLLGLRTAVRAHAMTPRGWRVEGKWRRGEERLERRRDDHEQVMRETHVRIRTLPDRDGFPYSADNPWIEPQTRNILVPLTWSCWELELQRAGAVWLMISGSRLQIIAGLPANGVREQLQQLHWGYVCTRRSGVQRTMWKTRRGDEGRKETRIAIWRPRHPPLEDRIPAADIFAHRHLRPVHYPSASVPPLANTPAPFHHRQPAPTQHALERALGTSPTSPSSRRRSQALLTVITDRRPVGVGVVVAWRFFLLRGVQGMIKMASPRP
ncbi:uncharacterized protein BXZ73DRAFT_83737 [Epithele typhae]|uniref:uncharacterized protein n=1 Tax=Epithele typhae TaxID=378194 RepID=UPI002007DE21|nr:uncharacterized protein BXZ73DRAFT_83737 [Epithele typhae]KAH9910310.1 hypothetical protein BXZ73DRAFT_83737 [Epithele typhae]